MKVQIESARYGNGSEYVRYQIHLAAERREGELANTPDASADSESQPHRKLTGS